MQPLMLWILRVAAVVMVGNGLWMMAHALHWFVTIPAALADTGHPNGHLIRDVGLAYVIFGAATVWATLDLAHRRAAFLCAALFMLGHALGHVAEILLGLLPASHWLIDLPLVLAPGVLFGVFIYRPAWDWLALRRNV